MVVSVIEFRLREEAAAAPRVGTKRTYHRTYHLCNIEMLVGYTTTFLRMSAEAGDTHRFDAPGSRRAWYLRFFLDGGFRGGGQVCDGTNMLRPESETTARRPRAKPINSRFAPLGESNSSRSYDATTPCVVNAT